MAAAGTAEAARAAPGARFGFGHPYDGGLYSCNGEASDWMLAAAGVLAYSPELGPEERAEVKKVARELLERLKALLVLNWRQKAAARSQLKLAIEDALDSGLPRAYTPELYTDKCSAVFEHVYESYPEKGAGVYASP
jgi:hypothetical protein